MQVHKRLLILAAFVLIAPPGSIAGNCGGHAMHHGTLGQPMLVQSREPNIQRMADPGSSGARLLSTYCSQCHGLPDPGQHGVQAWS